MNRNWTRRELSKVLGTVAAAASIAPATAARAFGEPLSSRLERSATERPASQPAEGLAFVASAPPGQPSTGAIHVFRTAGERWTPLTTVPAAAPAHLLLHPTLPVLYAVHAVDRWDHLPRGAVSAYRVDRQAGRLHLLGTQPLSLSATLPRHAVLTAGAAHLFVAAEGGGIYNLLPVAADGNLKAVSAIHKEFGMQDGAISKLAAPNSVALLPDGTLLAADAGLETLTSFTLTGDALVPAHRVRVHRGEGPSQLALSPGGRFAYTTGLSSGRVQRHRLVKGKPVNPVALVPRSASPLTLAKAYVPDAISLLQV